MFYQNLCLCCHFDIEAVIVSAARRFIKQHFNFCFSAINTHKKKRVKGIAARFHLKCISKCFVLPGHLFQSLAVHTDLLHIIRKILAARDAALPESLKQQLSALAVFHLGPASTDSALCVITAENAAIKRKRQNSREKTFLPFTLNKS